jgi:glycosyltransferase involved in cell wall biosynthesis
MKILVFPRDPNPYQRLLYAEMERHGARVSYLGQLTPSHALNLLLLPVETAVRRARGARIVHLHWVFRFVLPDFPGSRRLTQAWFGVWLRAIKLLGLRLVWTAHNVLPHAQVFADDEAARRVLVRHCDLVIAHTPSALAGLAEIGAVPRKSEIIRHGPMGPAAPAALRVPGSSDGAREFLFFGRIVEYKGLEELLAAFASLPPETPARLTVAGTCEDPRLQARLMAAENVRLRLEHVPGPEVADLLAGADVVVLPFRRITTSGSAELALAHGRPLIVPDLPGLAELPDGAVLRYDGSVPRLAEAVAELASAGKSRLAAMSAAASDYGSQSSWYEIADTTLTALDSLVRDSNQTSVRSSVLTRL